MPTRSYMSREGRLAFAKFNGWFKEMGPVISASLRTPVIGYRDIYFSDVERLIVVECQFNLYIVRYSLELEILTWHAVPMWHKPLTVHTGQSFRRKLYTLRKRYNTC